MQFSAETLMRETFAMIDCCDLVVIELTEKGVGLGIEAGYAAARGIPVVTVARAGTDISTTLRGISSAVCFYENAADLRAFFTQVREWLVNSGQCQEG